MPLIAPILDDRSYQQLRDELLKRIPVYAPEWSDHNASDPGVTLIELFAFLGENLLYRFNQIPDATRLEFLRLLQIPLVPASVAEAMVTMAVKPGADARVPKGTVVKAGNVPFETQDEVHVLPVTTRAMARIRDAAPENPELKEFTLKAMSARGVLEDEVAFYSVATVAEDPAAPDAIGTDFGATVDGTLWIAILGPGVKPDATPDERAAQKKEAIAGLLGQLLSIGVLLDEDVPPMAEVEACPGEGARSGGPAMLWQVSTGAFDPPGDETGVPAYRRVVVKADGTAGLTRSGVVRLALPASIGELGDFVVTDPDLPGTGELPPEIEDASVAATVLFWVRGARLAGNTKLPRIAWVGPNAARVQQSRTANPEFLGVGTGDADQAYALVNRGVIKGSVALDVEEVGRWTRWEAAEDFLASGEDDRHYVVDHEAGQVHFGNGVRGRAPQLGERIRTVSYRYGGGPDGNAPAKAITRIDVAGVTVKNPMRARGGAPAETVIAALDRIPGEIRRRDRAVTAGDFRELALQTPGAGLGRAECLPLFHPGAPDQEAAGVVSVVIWPGEDPRRPSAPMPDRTLIEQVCTWLDLRRLVTTELHVIPPTYRRIAVSVGLEVKPGYGPDAVRSWVELVLRQYLAPLPPYGPEGSGWPLGRRVHGPELEAAALQVEGVEYLEGLEVAEQAPDGSWIAASPPTVLLRKYEVPEVVEITVVQGAPMPPGTSLARPSDDTTAVPIPVLKEAC